MASRKSPKKKKPPCPDCNGSGTIPWATEMLKCATCDGKGTVDAVQKSSPKDRG